MAINYWSCPRSWDGKACFIVAGGPSLTGFDFDRLRGLNVIAINTSAFSVPEAPIKFFGDDRWGHDHGARLEALPGEIVTVASAAGMKRVRRMKKIMPPPSIMDRPDALSMRRTSLQASMNLAVHLGVSRIILLGADMKASDDGRSHHHKPHRWPQVPGCWDEQMQDLRGVAADLAQRGIDVVNTSLVSRIDWWPKRSVYDCLQEFQSDARSADCLSSPLGKAS